MRIENLKQYKTTLKHDKAELKKKKTTFNVKNVLRVLIGQKSLINDYLNFIKTMTLFMRYPSKKKLNWKKVFLK